ncbi:MAG TPA: outer membrane beta-barrel protein [Byssovorax sp.]|jgi:hypothetical protein
MLALRVAAPAALLSTLLFAAVAAADEPVPEPPPPAYPKNPAQVLDIGVFLDIGVRLGGSASFSTVERAAPGFGLGAAYSPSKWWGVGLEFNHAYLGHESDGAGAFGAVDVTRNLNSLWLDLDIHFLRNENLDGWVKLGPGLVWMTESASNLALDGIGMGAQTFTCSETDSARLGLRGGVGLGIPLGSNVFVAPMILAEGDQLGSDPVSGCAPGPGTVGVLSFRVAFFHRSILSGG